MIQFRRLVSIMLGLWLGGSIAMDVAVTQNFASVDRFLQWPGNVASVIELKKIGRPAARELLRRNAAEENNFLFENWERVQMAMATILFLILLFGDRPQIAMLAGTGLMLLIVIVQHFLLTPRVADLGRIIEGLPKEVAEVKTFWMLHGLYSGGEMAKLGIGSLFALRLVMKRKQDRDYFRKEYEADLGPASPAGKVI